jgi:hypothetical protein
MFQPSQHLYCDEILGEGKVAAFYDIAEKKGLTPARVTRNGFM